MPDNVSPLAFDDVVEVLSRALEAPRGVRMEFPYEQAAHVFRRRCYAFRTQDRKNAKRRYEKGHPLHGVSDYDRINITLTGTTLTFTRFEVPEGVIIEDF